MKIKKLSVKYHSTGLEIQNVEFDGTLSLLVGISGVGKTSILKAINDIKNIALYGSSINGFEWSIDFLINNSEYSWSGSFIVAEDTSPYNIAIFLVSDKSQEKYKIIKEDLYVNGENIIRRLDGDIYFNKVKTVKLEPTKSAINLLKEESEIVDIIYEFKNFDFISSEKYLGNSLTIINESFISKLDGYVDLDFIRSHDGNIVEKIYLCQVKIPDLFLDFKSVYQSIFPYVEDIEVETLLLQLDDRKLYQLVVKIKEFGVDSWVTHDVISSGMMKTLVHLAYIYFSQKGTVFMIDEFENGFGVNCINSISEHVLNADSDYQFIMTSHHPYIINNIPVRKWKIVNRRKNIITAESAIKHIDSSNHDAFIKLINSNFYTQGVEVNSNNNDLTEDDLYS